MVNLAVDSGRQKIIKKHFVRFLLWYANLPFIPLTDKQVCKKAQNKYSLPES
jgi:hypothetical protein